LSDSILSTDKISLVYTDGQRSTHALREVSIEIPNKRFVGIMGPSGSGKSSLLYILSGLKRPTSGDVNLGGYKFGSHTDLDLIDLRRQRFGFVFQQP